MCGPRARPFFPDRPRGRVIAADRPPAVFWLTMFVTRTPRRGIPRAQRPRLRHARVTPSTRRCLTLGRIPWGRPGGGAPAEPRRCAPATRDLATRQRPRRVAHRRVKSHASKRRVESLRCVEGVPGASVSGSSLVYARGCGASISTRAIALEDAVPVTPAEIDAEQAKAKEVRLVSAKGKAKYHPVIPRPSPAKIRRAHCVR